jgi:hypothetical protein
MKLLAILLLLSMPAVGQAQFTFTTNNDGSLNISTYSGSGALTIPDTFNNLPITSIGYNAFHLSGLNSVAMGTNITSIGIEAFMSSSFLKSVTIGSNVTSIGNGAFMNCAVLKSITIPDSVTNFGVNMFMLSPKLVSATLGNGVTSLPNNTFEDCTSLTNVVIGRSVASMGNAVFTQCPLIAITVDPQNQFYCSVNGVFFDKKQAALILCPGAQAGSSYAIPDSVTTIGQDAFYGCISLTSITIPNHVTDIQTSAFSGCSSLTSVTIGNSVANIEDAAFEGCSGLTSAIIPDSVTTIGQFAFYNCTSLATVIIGRGIATIVGGAFLDCSSLQGVYFRGNAPSSSESFSGDGSATAYYLPGTLGWSSRFGDPYGLPTAPWFLPNPTILNFEPNFGIQTNHFGFAISWATNISAVVEACTNLANPVWSPMATNSLTGGSCYFSDSQWTNYSRRFYRLRSP